jgi:hypothetical protein
MLLMHITPGNRTPQNLAHEFESAVKTIEERKRRMPATEDGAAYTAKMNSLIDKLAPFVMNGNILKSDDVSLDEVELVLVEVRGMLEETVAEFKSMDILETRVAQRKPLPQIVLANGAEGVPKASGVN